MPEPGTYQTRISDYRDVDRLDGDATLAAYGELYGRVQRKLFAAFAAGRSVTSLKGEYLREYGIPARMFNAVRVSLEGKIASVREGMQGQRDELEGRVAQVERQVARAVKQGWRHKAHQKRRRLASLRSRLAVLGADIVEDRVRLCFGSKRLWRKQYHLRSNGYSGREEWLGDWRAARSGEFFVLGSRDETGGCQLCVAQVADDGSLTLRVRLPDCLAEKHGKYLVIQGVRFAYGEEQVLAALESNGEYAAHRREHGEKSARATELGQAISYRFKRDAKGWRVFVSTEMMEAPAVTDQRRGAIGVDLNADHLAVAETDPSGNYVNAWRVPLVTYGKSKHQAEALIGDAVAGVVEYAREVGKPIVIEKLDFRHKKAALEGESPRYRRMLSSFSYGKLKAYFISRGYREGVEVKQVNPAFSSVVGRVKFRVKFMERYGLSVHQAAALVLARRLLGCSERIPHRWVAPIGNGVHVAFTVPERKRVKHVWTYWGAVLGQLRPALAAQHRQGKRLGNWRKRRPQSGSGCPAGPGPGGGVSGDQNGVPW